VGSSADSAAATPTPSTGQAYPGDNGLRSFTLDRGDAADASTMASLEAGIASSGNVLGLGGTPTSPNIHASKRVSERENL
jgi:hypothetical protein